jgi:hypothetical protein
VREGVLGRLSHPAIHLHHASEIGLDGVERRLTRRPIFTITQGVELLLRGRIVYDTSHGLPRNAVIKEVVDWMDKYWGTTR